jgi:hypothetical protein
MLTGSSVSVTDSDRALVVCGRGFAQTKKRAPAVGASSFNSRPPAAGDPVHVHPFAFEHLPHVSDRAGQFRLLVRPEQTPTPLLAID